MRCANFWSSIEGCENVRMTKRCWALWVLEHEPIEMKCVVDVDCWDPYYALDGLGHINFLQRQHERPSLGSEKRGHGPGEGARRGQGRIMTILSLIKTSWQSCPLSRPPQNQGADVNAAIDGRLPLHYASDYGQLEVIQYLLSKVRRILQVPPSKAIDLDWSQPCSRVRTSTQRTSTASPPCLPPSGKATPLVSSSSLKRFFVKFLVGKTLCLAPFWVKLLATSICPAVQLYNN